MLWRWLGQVGRTFVLLSDIRSSSGPAGSFFLIVIKVNAYRNSEVPKALLYQEEDKIEARSFSSPNFIQ